MQNNPHIEYNFSYFVSQYKIYSRLYKNLISNSNRTDKDIINLNTAIIKTRNQLKYCGGLISRLCYTKKYDELKKKMLPLASTTSNFSTHNSLNF